MPDAFPTFEEFFKQATARSDPPYPYQTRLATDGFPDLLDIPTGLGKTAAAILGWLWRRRFADTSTRVATPRRLVYCLPMRVLVEQTADFCKQCVANLSLSDVKIHLLMGGEDAEKWDERPEHDAILIGTQDMLLSRALNRGYGMSRYRWPMHFALLNNDCQWVMDETQLMGVGVETSAQLDAFRSRQFGTHGPIGSLWMSATLTHRQLETVDHPQPSGGWRVHGLEAQDRTQSSVQQRVQARKVVEKLPLILSEETKKDYFRQFAQIVLKRHQPDTLTLVVVNRVVRAQEIFRQLLLLDSGRNAKNTALVHSRFRPDDRARQESVLLGKGDRIVVATQAVEAGVDVSAGTLMVELAPWASMVQRFGRCNRYGEFKRGAALEQGTVLWVDIDAEEGSDLFRPYESAGVGEARSALEKLNDAGPQGLPLLPPPPIIRPVLRRKDLLDLFDTTPDLCGNDLDVSRYIRDGQDTDVQVFWRELGEEEPREDLPEPDRAELCSVPVGQFRDFLKGLAKRKGQAWCWNPLEKAWEARNESRPGQVYLLASGQGGYSDELGWTGDPKQRPSIAYIPSCANDSVGSDNDTFIGRAVELAAHLDHVAKQAEALVDNFESRGEIAPVVTGARWHDVGKAHAEFQAMLRNSDPTLSGDKLWAKSSSLKGHCKRTGFRHELASALAWLQLAPENETARDLIAYLIAAHHGKVRLSIRSWPNEKEPPGQNTLFARGVWDGDLLPPVALGNGETTASVELDLSVMRLGEGPRGESWLARMLRLRDDKALGPFRLAFLETLLRVADWRASDLEKGRP